MQKCKTKYCKNRQKKPHCSKCYSRMAREKNPILHSYLTLKANAKRRGKFFDLTLDQFTQFCYETNYMMGKGKSKDSYSIDRKENDKGYTLNNIRILTLSENSRKKDKVLHYDWETKEARVSTPFEIKDDDLYF